MPYVKDSKWTKYKPQSYEMKIQIIRAEDWKMDGGAGFGLIPKTLWSKQYPADDLNYIMMASRLLYIEIEERKILIDAGMGHKQSEKYYAHKYIQPGNSLLNSLKQANIDPAAITDVIVTHLHDDHVGGATYLDEGIVKLQFPNANHWISKAQWDWAITPNKREAGAYFNANFIPILEAGKITFFDSEGEHIPNIFFKIYNGHTVGNVIPVIKYKGKTLVFMADFIPYVASIPIPYISATDIQPVISLSEKEDFLNEAAANQYYLFFEHDFYHEIATVEFQGSKVVHQKSISLEEFLAL